ncbi:MAG: hypothetical protein K6E59_05015 [Bacilli bacterium]|nr:hypothetical protein [Bacilli bacterium]
MEEDPRSLALASVEAALVSDSGVFPLYQEKEVARAEYLRLRLEEGEDSQETKKAASVLREKEIALNQAPSAKEYSRLFTEIRFLTQEVDELLFGPFREKTPCGGNHG